jgi:AcrR family transcriptional regulator
VSRSTHARGDRPYHHGNLRQALLDAAMQMLATTPAAQLSLRELARTAQVSHAAPYHYFTDRHGLIRAVGVEAMRRLLQAQQAAVGHAGPSPRARLLALGRAYLGFAMHEPHAFALIFDPAYCQPGAPTEDMAPLIAENETLLAACVQQAQQAGVLPPGPLDALATALWGTVHGLAQLVMAGHVTRSQADVALDALLPSMPHPQ